MEVLAVTILGLTMFITSWVPKAVYLLQQIEIKSIPGPFLILISLTWGSSFLKLLFKIFVWCYVTTQSKNLFSILTISFLFFCFNFPLIAAMIFGLDVNLTLVYIFGLIFSALRFFIIPLEMILNNSKIRTTFKVKLTVIWSTIKIILWYVLICVIKCIRCIFRVCKCNQAAQIDIAE